MRTLLVPWPSFAIRFHLFELVFDQPAEIDAELAALVQARSASQPQLSPNIDPGRRRPLPGISRTDLTRRIPFIGVDQTVCGGPTALARYRLARFGGYLSSDEKKQVVM